MYYVVWAITDITTVTFKAIVPMTILVINVVVVIKVRRAAVHAVANLGVQPHHQSTSAVPTIMLITTSLMYVLLSATPTILDVIYIRIIRYGDFSSETVDLVHEYQTIVEILSFLFFVYNFYVYLITGKQFRSDLYKLFSRCHPPPPPPPAAIVAEDVEIARPVEADTAV